jgi:hypothetical protein
MPSWRDGVCGTHWIRMEACFLVLARPSHSPQRRGRRQLIQEHTREANRIQKVLGRTRGRHAPLPHGRPRLSFAKTPPGGQVVDPSAPFRGKSELDDHPPAPPGSTPPHPANVLANHVRDLVASPFPPPACASSSSSSCSPTTVSASSLQRHRASHRRLDRPAGRRRYLPGGTLCQPISSVIGTASTVSCSGSERRA